MKKSLMLSLVFFAAAFLPCTGTAATWDILYSFNATGEGGQAGIETNGTHIYTAEWRANVSPAFYEYNMDGTFDHSFDIAGVSQLRDMAYDGTYFYGSPANLTIYIMDLENESLAGTITVNCTGITGVRHIAYDPELDGGSGGFWIGNWNELGAIDMNGNQIYANISPTVSSIYGSAYDDSTPGGPYLWLFSQSVNAVFHQFDIATRTFTGTTHDCSAVPGFNNGLAGGAATYISGGNLILLADIQQAPNLIVAYELAPEQGNSTWTVTYDGNGALAGTVPVDASSPYLAGATVTVLGNTGNLTRTGYVFGGWNTASDGNGTDYAADDTFVMPAQDIVLYAQWEEEQEIPTVSQWGMMILSLILAGITLGQILRQRN
ncbi:MAG: IPTL-CTERM sorting domain-containing protein [Pseudomonadota bacterium]